MKVRLAPRFKIFFKKTSVELLLPGLPGIALTNQNKPIKFKLMMNFFQKNKKEKQPEKEIKKEKLFTPVGQLAVDVFQTEKELVIQSAIAGIKLKDLDISIEKDRLAIKGKREKPAESEKVNYFYQECYWGPFSREIILPVEINPSKAQAFFKEGILTIRMPKIEKEREKKIEVKE